MLTKIKTSDDQVEEGFLSNGFDLTCQAWEVRLFVTQKDGSAHRVF